MGLLIIANGFATIVGLINMFNQERKSEKETKKEDFLKWLEDHHHDDIRTSILKNEELLKGIEVFLKEDNKVIFEKLNKIDGILTSLLSNIEGVSEIARTLRPDAIISEQAINILRKLVNSTSKLFFIIQEDGHDPRLLLENEQQHIDYTEPKFLDDDLKALVTLGLLTHQHKEGEVKSYFITRNASRYIEALDKK
jgi:hypothetical protein